MNDAARREILTLSRDARSPASLGDWNTAVNSACFMLFRRTELYRGPMRALIVPSREITVRIYPEGTILVTTGLLDYIDDTLFESAALSARRMKNISAEREAMLVPFIAFEAARFALDLPFVAWCRATQGGRPGASDSYSATAKASRDDDLAADRFALVILALASLDPAAYPAWLLSLSEDASSTRPPNGALDRYRARFPPIRDRIDGIASARDDTDKIAAEFSNVLASIRSDMAFRESLSGVDALREVYPDSPYLARLEALIRHELWLSGTRPEETVFNQLIPVARETAFMKPLRPWFSQKDNGSLPPARSPKAGPPGDQATHENAVTAYARALAFTDDPTMEAAYASLLAWSPDRDTRQEALRMAAEAASFENGFAPFIARANYASILFLSGADSSRAIAMLERLQSDTAAANEGESLIPYGIPGDWRDVGENLSAMYRLTGRSTPRPETQDLTRSPAGDEKPIPIEWRRVRIGSSVDELLERWGEPDKIAYDVYSERWEYRALSAVVSVGAAMSDGEREVKSILIGQNSPLTPGGDIRVGHSRADFEAVFGKPRWYADDSAVYRYRGNMIAVLYLADVIREMRTGM